MMRWVGQFSMLYLGLFLPSSLSIQILQKKVNLNLKDISN